MKRRLGSYFKAIGIKSGEILDVAGIRFDIYSLTKDRESKFTEMGKMAYRMFLKDKIDQKRLFDECRDIVELDRRIKQREDQIKKIHESAEKTLKKNIGRDYKSKVKKHSEKLVEAESYDVDISE